MPASDLSDRILAGDVRAVARAASLVEAQAQAGRDLIASVFSRTGHAAVIGITGPPGAGKSTLVNEFIRVLRNNGEKVGVIAVDPSSPYSRGAVLGDRIRMLEHHADPGVFIRSTATRGKLGGLAKNTLDLALLMDAAGYTTVLIETVGVGQDEIEIARLAGVTVLVLVPGMGDDVQAIKAGIMEIADVFAINKADLPGADRLEAEIRAAQSYGSEVERSRAAPLRRIVASEGKGVDELLQVIQHVLASRAKIAEVDLWALRLEALLRDRLLESLPTNELKQHAANVASRKEDPYTALDRLTTSLLSAVESRP